MPRKVTIPDFPIKIIGEDKEPTGEIQTVAHSMVSIISQHVTMGAANQMRFWRACLPLLDCKVEESAEVADSDFEYLETTWFGLPEEKLQINRQIALISEMLKGAETVQKGTEDAKPGAEKS